MGEIQQVKRTETVYATPTGTIRLRANDGAVFVDPIGGMPVWQSMEENVCSMLSRLAEHAYPGDTESQVYHRVCLRQVICEFWRYKFDRDMPQLLLTKRAPKDTKILVRAEARLWEATFDCLEQINLHGAWGFDYPVTDLGEALLRLILEKMLIAITHKTLPKDTTNAKEGFIQPEQAINKALRDWTNPFEMGSFTYSFIESCLALAEKSTNFDRKHWKPLLKSRSEFVTLLKDGGYLTLFNVGTGKAKDKRNPKKAVRFYHDSISSSETY